MNLYRTAAVQDGETKEVIWTGSRAEAAKARKELTAKGFTRAEIETEDFVVPTAKNELITWLNWRAA